MDPLEEAIAAAAEGPGPLVLTLSSTGRQALLPPNPTASELVDIAGWAQTQALQLIVRTVVKQQGSSTMLSTPRGPVAVRRGNLGD